MSFSALHLFDLPLLRPAVNFNDSGTVKILLRARTELGELKGYSSALPNPMLLLSPAVLKESVISSRIENINTTVESVLQMQLFPEIEQQKPEKEALHPAATHFVIVNLTVSIIAEAKTPIPSPRNMRTGSWKLPSNSCTDGAVRT